MRMVIALVGIATGYCATEAFGQVVVEQPTTSVTYEQREETVIRQEIRQEYVETERTVMVPVTQYHWEPRVHHWWNPLVPNTIAYHMVPRTHWEAHPQKVRYPQLVRRDIPEKRTVLVPRRELSIARKTVPSNEPQVIVRSAEPARPQATIARQPNYIGGIQQLEGDLPRHSTNGVYR